MDLKRNIVELEHDVRKALKERIDLKSPLSTSMISFDDQRRQHLRQRIRSRQRPVQDLLQVPLDASAEELLAAITRVKEEWQELASDRVIQLEDSLIPLEVRADILADLEELQRCFDAQCFRSCIILCGRLLETALHRAYFEVTGVDLLEKAPGTGLGSLIKKLHEKSVFSDPGLPNQVHLINQVRIHSVHKKSVNFIPSKEQTRAIMLYTGDIIRRLFRKDL